MSNILDEIKLEVLSIKQLLERQQYQAKTTIPQKITFTDYCRQEDISRPTGYRRIELGLVKSEKIGGKIYIFCDSISTVRKYQRVPA